MAQACSPQTTSGSRASSIAGGFQRKQSYMALQKSPDKKLFEDDDDEQEVEENRVPKYHHRFLDSCFLCESRLDGDDDIFMYKGEMAFCSEECREQHMELEELKERRRRRGILKKRSIVKVSRENPSSSSTSHSTTVAVA
ncbi:hypothetical protein ZOSMA_96G00130 [Zostera marina]|uniref:FLZ-type domain-containing protein n=1 Tax=Zostera marina TaxID=29655 RepID=A0A0K9NHV4_ZOSMR|nr:hypothetical protein ZOSMA_96G00130 [Zostera marina]